MLGCVRSQSRNGHARAARGDRAGDLGDLLRRFSAGVYDFWKALSQGAVVIDRGEAKRFDWFNGECVERGSGVELTVRNPLEQVANVLASHKLIPRRSPATPRPMWNHSTPRLPRRRRTRRG